MDRRCCHVCLVVSDRIFNCEGCDNEVCGGCSKGELKSCPGCGQDLNVRPLVRNRACEMFLGLSGIDVATVSFKTKLKN
jgi:hypothetical protein